MNLGTIAAAYPSLQKLANIDMDDFNISYQIYKLISEIKNDFENFSKTHLDICIKYGKESETPGLYRFENTEKSDKATKAINSLRETESNFKMAEEPVKIKIPKSKIKISAYDIGNLMPFVEFTEG